MEKELKSKHKISWLWKAYLLCYVAVILSTTVLFFTPGTQINLYYRILVAYDVVFLIQYSLNCLSIILNTFSLVPLYLFVRQIYVLSPRFWQGFLLVRLVVDVTCRPYEYYSLKSLAMYDWSTALRLLLLVILFNLPSYGALFLYAFRRKNTA